MIKGAGNGYNGTRKGKIQPLSGNGEVLSGLIKNSGMLIADGADSFRFRDIFREFLTREDARTRTDAQRRTALSRGGLYYELHGNVGRALYFYDKSGESDKVSELLIKSTYLHPGMGHYEELENFSETLGKGDAVKKEMKSRLAWLDISLPQRVVGNLRRSEFRRATDLQGPSACTA